METLRHYYDELLAHPIVNGLLPHLLTVAGFLLAFFAIARLMSERKQPGNTFAWLFAIAFVPYVGVPLFLMFGGRKVKRLAARKGQLCPVLPGVPPAPSATTFAARVLTLNGACPPLGGHRVTFLSTGEESFEQLERGLREAKHSIHLMTFILGRDAVGKRIVKLLAARAKEGLKVRLLLDGLGCFMSSGRFCDPIRKAGGEVVTFMPVMPLQTRALRQPPQPPQGRHPRPSRRRARRPQPRRRIHGPHRAQAPLARPRRRHRGPGRAAAR